MFGEGWRRMGRRTISMRKILALNFLTKRISVNRKQLFRAAGELLFGDLQITGRVYLPHLGK